MLVFIGVKKICACKELHTDIGTLHIIGKIKSIIEPDFDDIRRHHFDHDVLSDDV
jgi:hypothetical protein